MQSSYGGGGGALSTALTGSPQSELTLNDISGLPGRSSYLGSNSGNGGSGPSAAAANPSVVLLRNRKLELELQRKDAEIRRLGRDFEDAKKKATATVVELQKQVRGGVREQAWAASASGRRFGCALRRDVACSATLLSVGIDAGFLCTLYQVDRQRFARVASSALLFVSSAGAAHARSISREGSGVGANRRVLLDPALQRQPHAVRVGCTRVLLLPLPLPSSPPLVPDVLLLFALFATVDGTFECCGRS